MYDNGAFDVDGETVTARSSRVVDLGGPPSSTPVELTTGAALVTTLDDLRAAVGG